MDATHYNQLTTILLKLQAASVTQYQSLHFVSTVALSIMQRRLVIEQIQSGIICSLEDKEEEPPTKTQKALIARLTQAHQNISSITIPDKIRLMTTILDAANNIVQDAESVLTNINRLVHTITMPCLSSGITPEHKTGLETAQQQIKNEIHQSKESMERGHDCLNAATYFAPADEANQKEALHQAKVAEAEQARAKAEAEVKSKAGAVAIAAAEAQAKAKAEAKQAAHDAEIQKLLHALPDVQPLIKLCQETQDAQTKAELIAKKAQQECHDITLSPTKASALRRKEASSNAKPPIQKLMRSTLEAEATANTLLFNISEALKGNPLQQACLTIVKKKGYALKIERAVAAIESCSYDVERYQRECTTFIAKTFPAPVKQPVTPPSSQSPSHAGPGTHGPSPSHSRSKKH